MYKRTNIYQRRDISEDTSHEEALQTMMTHFQDSKQNPKKKKKIKRRAWPHFMSCNSSNRPEADPAPIDSQPSMFHHGDNNESSQFVSSSARTFTNTNTNTTPAWRRDSSSSCPPWSITSLLAILPDSPSPICSSSTTSPKSFPPSSEMVYPRASNELSTPRNQDTLSDMSKPSESSKEIDEWIENANNLPCSYEPNLQSKEDGSMKRSSISTVFESALTEIPSITLPTIAEDKSSLECRQSRYESPGFESPFDGRHKLMTRPKPYREFLDEIKRLELEARINAWKSAKHMKYMDKLRRKEAAINDWEFKQTSKAMKEKKKIESKLENKRTKALEKTRKKISIVQKNAAEKKARERSSTFDKISRVAKKSEKLQAARNLIWFTLMRLC